jgi:2-polyprenyl-3-methyl-5-hydroxy-6-metoxy-1,4-benzoquinol methylase
MAVVTASSTDNDLSNGWEAAAAQLIERRDQVHVGIDVVRSWAANLSRGALILDLGCGSGVPVSQALMAAGFRINAIDASPTLVAMR